MVVLSGLADDVITIEAVRRGAQDYLVKGEISGPLVMRVMRYAIERKQVEGVFRASEARYRTLVETSPNGITLADLEGKLLVCNQQATRLFGYSKPEAMLGINVFKLIVPRSRRLAVLNTQKTLNENKVSNNEYTMLRRDGSEFPAEISSAVLHNNSGTATGFISIIRDISEHKQAIEAEKQLVLLEKEFISSVSYELRLPLLSILEYLDLLLNGKGHDPTEQNELLAHASQDARRILDMADELADFSMLEGDRLTLNWAKADLATITADVLASFREQANARRISLLTAPVASAMVADMDPIRIRRVLAKLVDFAIKTSRVGGKVLVTSKAMNGDIVMNIIDEGIGISSEDCTRIFDKYFQASQPIDENAPGMGMGLYISKQIVEAHHGTLSLSSQMGAGSTFTLTIPLVKKLKSIPKSM